MPNPMRSNTQANINSEYGPTMVKADEVQEQFYDELIKSQG